MMTIDRFLCRACERNMREAQLVYKKLPGTDDAEECAWCHERKLGAVYRIKTGKGVRKW